MRRMLYLHKIWRGMKVGGSVIALLALSPAYVLILLSSSILLSAHKVLQTQLLYRARKAVLILMATLPIPMERTTDPRRK